MVGTAYDLSSYSTVSPERWGLVAEEQIMRRLAKKWSLFGISMLLRSRFFFQLMIYRGHPIWVASQEQTSSDQQSYVLLTPVEWQP